MTLIASIVVLVAVALSLGWLAAEFGKHRWLRIGLGLAVIGSATVVAAVFSGVLSRFNYNAWYGGASKALIETTIAKIEDGNQDRVLSVLRRLDLDYQPTYENRAHYDELVQEAVAEMQGDHDLANTRWKTLPFRRDTWLGHWESPTGYWLVISHSLEWRIIRSGDSIPEITQATLSEDCRTLTFIEGDQWRHELTLNNKYEAQHVWRRLEDDSVWQTNTLLKLVPPGSAQRVFTQQPE